MPAPRICSGGKPRMAAAPPVVRVEHRDRGIVARLLAQDVAHQRQVLDGVAVGVDDGWSRRALIW